MRKKKRRGEITHRNPLSLYKVKVSSLSFFLRPSEGCIFFLGCITPPPVLYGDVLPIYFSSNQFKVIPEVCIAHSYCARILRHQRAHMSARAYKT